MWATSFCASCAAGICNSSGTHLPPAIVKMALHPTAWVRSRHLGCPPLPIHRKIESGAVVVNVPSASRKVRVPRRDPPRVADIDVDSMPYPSRPRRHADPGEPGISWQLVTRDGGGWAAAGSHLRATQAGSPRGAPRCRRWARSRRGISRCCPEHRRQHEGQHCSEPKMFTMKSPLSFAAARRRYTERAVRLHRGRPFKMRGVRRWWPAADSPAGT